MVNARTFNTFYDDVQVPRRRPIVGELNRGWDLIVNQLNYERVSLAPPGMVERIYEDDRRAGPRRPSCADGRRVDRPGVGRRSTWPGSGPSSSS